MSFFVQLRLKTHTLLLVSFIAWTQLMTLTSCVSESEKIQAEKGRKTVSFAENNLKMGMTYEEVNSIAPISNCRGSDKGLKVCTATFLVTPGMRLPIYEENPHSIDKYQSFTFHFTNNKLQKWELSKELSHRAF